MSGDQIRIAHNFTPFEWCSLVKACRCVPCRLFTRGMEDARPINPDPVLNQWDLTLTPRDEALLHALGLGLANKGIADRLGLSESTVKTKLSALFQKLGVADRTQAALMARELGVIDRQEILR